MAGTIRDDGAVCIAWRLFAGFGGGYALTNAFVAASGKLLPLLGLARGEAVSLALMLALIVYVPVCLMMFATRRPVRDGLAVLAVAAMLALSARTV